MSANGLSFIYWTVLLLRGLIQLLIRMKIALYAFQSVLKYVVIKSIRFMLWVYQYGQLDRGCRRKINVKVNSHNKSVLSWSISAGLMSNNQFNIEPIMMFIYGLVSRTIRDVYPKFCASGRVIICQPQIFSKMMSATNILIVFSLDLIQLTLKCGKPFLDPFVPKLCDDICCNNVRVTTVALKCMSLELLDVAITVFGTIFLMPVQSVFKSIVNILWNNHKRKFF